MNWFRKMAGVFSRPVSVKDPATWPTASHNDLIGSEKQALALSAVYACVRLISSTQAGLPCQVFKTAKDGSYEIDKTHNLYRLLHDSPNSEQTSLEFWEQISLSLEMRGNAYAAKNKVKGKIVALTPIHPDSISASRREDGKILYRWGNGIGGYLEGTSDDILHFRGFGGDSLGGLSTLDLASQTFSIAKQINTAARTSFENGMAPSGVITFKEFLSTEKRDAVNSALKDKYIGAVNTGRPLLLEGGSSWQQLSVKPEEAQMLESRGFSIEEICRYFGVPPFMIGHTEKTTSWGTGLSEQVLGFQKFSLNPRIERLEQRLMKDLLTAEDRAAGYIIEFNFDGLLRSDTFKRFQAYEIALRNGWETINSVRRMENKPPISGGDIPMVQSQNIPITMAGQRASNQGLNNDA